MSCMCCICQYVVSFAVAKGLSSHYLTVFINFDFTIKLGNF